MHSCHNTPRQLCQALNPTPNPLLHSQDGIHSCSITLTLQHPQILLDQLLQAFPESQLVMTLIAALTAATVRQLLCTTLLAPAVNKCYDSVGAQSTTAQHATLWISQQPINAY